MNLQMSNDQNPFEIPVCCLVNGETPTNQVVPNAFAAPNRPQVTIIGFLRVPGCPRGGGVPGEP